MRDSWSTITTRSGELAGHLRCSDSCRGLRPADRTTGTKSSQRSQRLVRRRLATAWRSRDVAEQHVWSDDCDLETGEYGAPADAHCRTGRDGPPTGHRAALSTFSAKSATPPLFASMQPRSPVPTPHVPTAGTGPALRSPDVTYVAGARTLTAAITSTVPRSSVVAGSSKSGVARPTDREP